MARAFGSRGQFDSNALGLERALATHADQLPFDDASVDVILCSYLMFVWLNDEHDLAKIFNEYLRVLKPEGIVKLYPFYQWRYTQFETTELLNALSKFRIQQHFVHGGLDFRVTPSMLTEFTPGSGIDTTTKKHRR